MTDLLDERVPPPSKRLRHYLPASELQVRDVQDEQGDGTGGLAIFGP